MGGWLELLDPDGEGRASFKLSPLDQLIVAAGALALFAAVERLRHLFWIVDGANLIIHEAGHPIFNVVFLGNRFMMFVGGTAMQLLMPFTFYVHFLRDRRPASADVCLAWFGENFLHIAPYVADARSMDLPLIGGGEHDWNYLLGALHLLPYDRQLSSLCDLAGCLILALALRSLHARWKSRSAGSAPAPEA
jgi:hypothetical protein